MLVRDCSCRGSSGFAHFSCIVGWAESEGRKAMKGTADESDWINCFVVCPNCKQDYQNDVDFDMKGAALDFVEREYESDLVLNMQALLCRTAVLCDKNEGNRAEGEALCSKLLSIIDTWKLVSEKKQKIGVRYCRSVLRDRKISCVIRV
jgi:hypothetical protein